MGNDANIPGFGDIRMDTSLGVCRPEGTATTESVSLMLAQNMALTRAKRDASSDLREGHAAESLEEV